MESNITNEQYFETGSLTEPHFDEEATLLLARPVVPLEEIQSEARSKKRLKFGLAIACSLALGALSATLLYKNSGPDPSTAITQAAPGAAGITVAATLVESVDAGATGISPQSEVQTPAPPVATKPLPSVSRSSQVVVKKAKTPMPPQLEERERNRDERFYERRLRRMSDREAMKESRRRHRRSKDDLLRVRDIFEGPPRP
jgi:hypothetical protein